MIGFSYNLRKFGSLENQRTKSSLLLVCTHTHSSQWAIVCFCHLKVNNVITKWSHRYTLLRAFPRNYSSNPCIRNNYRGNLELWPSSIYWVNFIPNKQGLFVSTFTMGLYGSQYDLYIITHTHTPLIANKACHHYELPISVMCGL